VSKSSRFGPGTLPFPFPNPARLPCNFEKTRIDHLINRAGFRFRGGSKRYNEPYRDAVFGKKRRLAGLDSPNPWSAVIATDVV
jgi:hypothetical protein